MDKTQLMLASVKLVNNGLKGVEIEYLQPSRSTGIEFLDLYKSKRRAPIHSELENLFSDLREHMLNICGYSHDKDEREYLMNMVGVTGIKYGAKGIMLNGYLTVLGDMGSIDLSTPIICDELYYADFAQVKKIAEAIYHETREYMAGNRIMSDSQIIARFNAKNKDFDINATTELSAKDLHKLAIDTLLEETDYTVIHEEEVPTEKIREKKAAIKAPVWPEPGSTFEEDPKAPVTLIQEEDFALPIANKPVAKSTAKKKA